MEWGPDLEPDQIGRMFRVQIERFRCALLMAPKMTPAQRQVALLMLERSNREWFFEEGILCSWMSEALLAAVSGLSDRGVRKARHELRRKGVIVVVDGGGNGRRDTTTYQFDKAWLSTTESHLKATGIADAWAGRRNARSLLRARDFAGPRNQLELSQGGTPIPTRGNAGSPTGEQEVQKRGNAASPESIDKTYLKESLERVPVFGERSASDVRQDQHVQWGELLDNVERLSGMSREAASILLISADDVERHELENPSISNARAQKILRGVASRIQQHPDAL